MGSEIVMKLIDSLLTLRGRQKMLTRCMDRLTLEIRLNEASHMIESMTEGAIMRMKVLISRKRGAIRP